MDSTVKHYWPNIPRLGNVALSRHAQARAEEDHISEHAVEDVLLNGTDRPDGVDTTWRERNGVRLVIITPTPFQGAKLVKTMYRIKAQERAH